MDNIFLKVTLTFGYDTKYDSRCLFDKTIISCCKNCASCSKDLSSRSMSFTTVVLFNTLLSILNPECLSFSKSQLLPPEINITLG